MPASPTPSVEQFLSEGAQHHQAGRFAEAEARYRAALALDATSADATHLLAMVSFDLKKTDEALTLMRKSLELKPDSAAFHSNFALLCRQLGRADEAIEHWRRQIALDPAAVNPHVMLAQTLQEQFGPSEESLDHARRAVALDPKSPAAHTNLGTGLAAHRRIVEAARHFAIACSLAPSNPAVLANVGWACEQLGRLDEGERACRRALELSPSHVPAMHYLAGILRQRGRVDDAMTLWKRCIELVPQHAEAWNCIGAMAFNFGLIDEALAAYQNAVAHAPRFAAAHSNLVYCMLFHPACDGQAIFEVGRQWDRIFAEPLRPQVRAHENDRSADRKLRIGYVSPDLRGHTIGRNLLPLIERHDRAQFEIVCYFGLSGGDEVTTRLKNCADAWHETAGWADDEFAARVRAHRIDILVDLTQHLANNRMPVFARQPAPVQVAHMAYPASTGVSTIDYRFTDAQLEPPDEGERFSVEKLLRLRSYWCYRCEDAVEVNDLPCEHIGRVTFACLNHPGKINERAIALWAKVLNAVPDAQLAVLAPSSAQLPIEMYCRGGIDPQRVRFLPRSPHADYLRLYHQIDIGLDSLPYTGHTTSCDSFWMGVPVLTLRGQTSVARGGASLLTSLGLPELIADTEQEFVEIATALACDRQRLALLRRELRGRMKASPLCDEAGYAREVEAAYRTIWSNWCSGVPMR